MANYQTNGYIDSMTITSKPTYVFAGQTMSSYLASVSVRLKIRKSSLSPEEIVDTNLLAMLGDGGAKLVMTMGASEPQEFTFDLGQVQQGMLFPVYQHSISLITTLTFSFSNWLIDDTYNGTTYAQSFSYQQDYHSICFQYAGEFEITDIESDIEVFYVNGYSSNIVAENGSLFDLFSHYEITDNNSNTYDLWDLLKYSYTIQTNKSSYSTATSIDGNTTDAVALLSLNKFFSHCNNNGETTTITLNITYFDTTNEIDRTLEIEFDIALYGIVSLRVVGLGEFVEQTAKNSMARVSITTTNGIGITDIPGSLENYYNSATLSFTNTDTSTLYALGDNLPNGHYTISVGLVINPTWTMLGNGTIRIYDSTPSSLSASLIKTSFRVGEIFSDTNIILYAQYLIYGNDYVRNRIYYPNFSSNYNNHRFVGNDYPQVSITIEYENLTTTTICGVYFAEKDELWFFDKKTFIKANYGEIQQGFNMNFVLDETKDNTKISVFNHSSEDIKPFTIAYMVSTDSWWIVQRDKVVRYDSENNPLYQHDISLLGAIEILNARDLTTCGFNVNHYTIEQFFNRLVKMCDFELPIDFDYGTYVNQLQNVDYLKTFENYSPLSAIKEMCSGLNVEPKMIFQLNNDENEIIKAIITFIPKSGTNDPIIDIEDFDDSQEMITNDKENYGSKVISNIQNVVSGKVVRYPAVGTVHISSDGNKVQYENAMIRLPSKANYVESLDIYGHVVFTVGLLDGNNETFVSQYDLTVPGQVDYLYDQAKAWLDQQVIDYAGDYIALRDQFVADEQKIKEYLANNCFIRLQNGAEYNQIDKNNNWSGEWNGKQVEMSFNGLVADYVDGHPGIGPNRSNSIGLNDKKHYDVFPQQICLVYWEQGSDLIKNFRFYDKFTANQNASTESVNAPTYANGDYAGLYNVIIKARVRVNLISTFEATYAVNYIPMTDMKLKVENGIFENDSHLYNQNGTMVASKAVSKLINSHADSISSNQITRYKRYYNFWDIPKIGQVVNNNGISYIINNISIDFSENDNNDYIFDCQFSMTKKVACKSTMISANTNIRDYKTPQDHNVYRVQNYRDLIYFDYVNQEHNSYMPYNDLFNIGSSYTFGATKGYVDNHTAIMKIKWAENSINYYQLPSIKYDLEKMVVETIDFKDNNIIGYAVNNSNHPFQVQTWWVLTDLIQTPVSYVDDVGHLIGIDILMCDNEQLIDAYDTLGYSGLYSTSCIIPDTLYNQVLNDYDAEIKEDDYDKDGLEIPMFIYSCQVINNKDIVVPSDIFNAEKLSEDEFYCYGFVISDNRITENVGLGENGIDANVLPMLAYGISLSILQEISIDNSHTNYIDLTFREDLSWLISNNTFIGGSLYSQKTKNKNIAIIRYKFNVATQNGASERPLDAKLVLGINNCQVNLSSGVLRLYKNSKKL